MHVQVKKILNEPNFGLIKVILVYCILHYIYIYKDRLNFQALNQLHLCCSLCLKKSQPPV